MDDWKEIVGHDFTPEDWAEIQRNAERLVMEARSVTEAAMTGEADQQAYTLADMPADLKASMLATLERDLAEDKERAARRSAALDELASIDGDML